MRGKGAIGLLYRVKTSFVPPDNLPNLSGIARGRALSSSSRLRRRAVVMWDYDHSVGAGSTAALQRQNAACITCAGNYGIGCATSKSPTGPFVKYAGNPITHRGGNVLGPGHHCIVAGPDGKLWLVYHQKWNAERNFHRFLALVPIWFGADGCVGVRLMASSRGAIAKSSGNGER